MPSRSPDPIELSLESRQVAGIVVGSLVTLAVVFALGVGFGQRLATAPAPTAPPADLRHLDSKPATPALSDTGFTFQDSLVKGDPNAALVAKPPPAPKKAPAPPPRAPASAPPSAPLPATVAMSAEPSPAARAIEGRGERPASSDPARPTLIDPRGAAALPALPKAADKAPAATKEAGRWCVQFGASPQRADADSLAATLAAKGYPAYVISADLPGKGRFFRVRVGRFATKEEAERLRLDARSAHGLSGLLMPIR